MNFPAPNPRADEAVSVRRVPTESDSGAFPIETLDDLPDEIVPKPWLFKGVMARGETSEWYGPPGSLKSALLAEAAICLATGRDWRGRKNMGPAGVVYFALERAPLVRARLRAHRRRDKLGRNVPVTISAATIDLMKVATVPRVVNTIMQAQKMIGCPVGLVIFDTFAKLIAAGGGDEDKARDQGAVFTNIQRIKDQLRDHKIEIHVALVGHTGKDAARGARGSNAVMGDVDVMVSIKGEVTRTATIIKANDVAEGPLFSFGVEIFNWGNDEDGDPQTVGIIASDLINPPTVGGGDSKARLSPNQQTMFGILHDAGERGLSTDDWNERTREAGIGNRRRADLIDIRSVLKAKGLIRQTTDGWAVNHQ